MSLAPRVVGNAAITVQQRKTFGYILKKSIFDFPMIYVGSIIVLVLMIVAVFAPYLAPQDPLHQFSNGISATGQPIAPNHVFPWGTDDLGRDEMSRIIYGSRVSLEVGIFAMFISLTIGTTFGLISGFFGGFIDNLLMRITDVVLAFPFFLFTMALVAVLRPSMTNIFVAIGVTGWGTMARIVRGQVLTVKEFEYVQAAKALGASWGRILFRHVLPNVTGPIIVLAALSVGNNMLAEAGLSVLGIGVQPPHPSWGNMIYEGLQTFTYAPWMMYLPGIALLIAVLGFNLLGDGLEGILDPHNSTH